MFEVHSLQFVIPIDEQLLHTLGVAVLSGYSLTGQDEMQLFLSETKYQA